MIRMFDLQMLMSAHSVVAVLSALNKAAPSPELAEQLETAKETYQSTLLRFSKLYPIDEVIL